MNKYTGTDKDIHKRIYKFVINCFNSFVKKIPKTTENLKIINQISSSVTSMGANDMEADACISRKDFVQKYSIVKKETKETLYWLNVTRDTFILENVNLNQFIEECHEILLIVSSIINNARR